MVRPGDAIAPFMPKGKRGRPPFTVESLLRIHFMPQWFTMSAPEMEEALNNMPLFRDFAGRGGWDDWLLDECTVLHFRHVLEKTKLAERILVTVNVLLGAKSLMLCTGTVADATLISAKFFLVNCPTVEMDSDEDGVSCEKRWCQP